VPYLYTSTKSQILTCIEVHILLVNVQIVAMTFDNVCLQRCMAKLPVAYNEPQLMSP